MVCPTEKGPDGLAVFTTVRFGAPLVLEKTQVKSAPALTFAPGIVRVEPASEVKEPLLPVTALLASVQVALLRKKPPMAGSLMVTGLAMVETLFAVGAAGVGVLAATVVMLLGVVAIFVVVKEKGPPNHPKVVICTVKVWRRSWVKRQG